MDPIGPVLFARARRSPDRAAFLDASLGEQLTWAALAAHLQRWERRSRCHSLPVGCRVALVVDDPLTFTASYLSCLSRGDTVAPLDPRRPVADLGRVVRELRAEVVATDREELATGLRDTVSCTVLLERRGPARPWLGSASLQREAAVHPAALLMSSGTTGAPKGIPLTAEQLFEGARRVVTHHGLTPADRCYCPLPLFHVNAQVIGLISTVLSGGSLVVDRRFERSSYWARVEEYGPTWLNAVPAILATLVGEAAPSESLAHRIRFARSASAPLPLETNLGFSCHCGVGVLETYGMTEAAGQITANPLEERLRRPGSVGLAVGIELRIVTDEGELAQPGESGLVELRGPGVVTQYVGLGGAGETVREARGDAGWLSTGDAGSLDEEGFLTLYGRVDDVINRGGEKFHPRDVEEVLREHEAVAEVAVVAAPDPRLGQVPVAFVKVATGFSGDLSAALRAHCATRIVRWRRPVEFRAVEQMPLGPTGKVLRRKLREQFETSLPVAS